MGVTKRAKEGKLLLTRMMAGMTALFLLLSVLGMSALAVSSKKSTSRAIAIVFDNSGSMYMNRNKAWCRATYAIEVFASMMNEGDTLQVYPMYDVTVGGTTYTSLNPFVIRGGGDTSVIQTLYTPFAGDTPIETIGDAYHGLMKIGADERWLIVLTDGAVFYENDQELRGEATKKRLEEVLTQYNQDVNVLYLGIDSAAVIPAVENNGTYQYHSDKAAQSTETLSKLTEMCNMIFGRDVLSNAGNRMTFDVSMKKLILFVQGSGIRDVELKNADGVNVGIPSQAYSPRYGELGVGTWRADGRTCEFSADTSLSGYIAVYDTELEAGTYSLSYSGDVSSVGVYYEPDIDLAVSLTDEYGTQVSSDSELYPGTYRINYGMVDKNGEPTASDLLGKTSYTVTYVVNGEAKTVKSDESGRIGLELAEGDVLDGQFSVTYLSGYTITKSASDFNWPSGGWRIAPRPAGQLELKLTGGQDVYKLSELEKTSCAVQLLYEGAPLTAEQLALAEISVLIEGGNAGYELTPDGNGYALTLKYAGTAAETLCGPYTMDLTAQYVNEFGVTSQSDEVNAAFRIEDDGYLLEMKLEGENYFVISKLAESEPIRVILSADGAPLSEEQLASTTLTVDGDGLTCKCEPLPGQSAFAVQVVGDGNAKAGHYDLKFAAASQDQVGRAVTAEAHKSIELSTYPLWLRVLVISLILLLIAALIWLYLNMKVLPKRITLNAGQTAFIVEGDTVNGAARCSCSGGGKHSGSVQVTTPNYTGNPLIRGGFTLNLTAVSPRRVKSSRRRAMVTGISVTNSSALQSLSIGTHSLVKVDEGDGIMWMFDGKQVSSSNVTTGFELGGRPVCTFVGETISGETFTMTAQLLFK